MGPINFMGPIPPNQNDLKSKWTSESGLFRLIMRTDGNAWADEFQQWMEEQVLPSIRKTGSYSLPGTATPTAAQLGDWTGKRVEGKELFKLKNAALKELIQGCFGNSKLFAICNNLVNQAVVGYTSTTKKYKQTKQLPNHMSIPDFLNRDGQVARCLAETAFRKYILDNAVQLRELNEGELVTKFEDMASNLRSGFMGVGMGDLEKGMLSLEDARKRKKAVAEAPPAIAPAPEPQAKKARGTLHKFLAGPASVNVAA
jgi:prophage antirepressor-like protein